MRDFFYSNFSMWRASTAILSFKRIQGWNKTPAIKGLKDILPKKACAKITKP